MYFHLFCYTYRVYWERENTSYANPSYTILSLKGWLLKLNNNQLMMNSPIDGGYYKIPLFVNSWRL